MITISIQTYFKIYIAKIGCMVAFGVVFINVKMVLLKMIIPELYWCNVLVLFKEFHKV